MCVCVCVCVCVFFILFLKLRNLNFSTCYKVCNVHGVEVVLKTATNTSYVELRVE